LPVSTEKVDEIINLVGELVITQSMLEQTIGGLDSEAHGALLEGLNQLQRNARDLQEAVMSVRMMPMDYAFNRFPRLVRDLSSKLGKQINLVTEGESTELDKGLIERIMDPMTHLVRNSLDHGIETPERRKAAGKPAAGTLTLAAQHQGGSILIDISDDGAGLNRERILAKARQNGLAVSDSMSDDEVWQLIFAPGFSTAEAVTDVSGRGVGMDVVKRNIQELGGHVDIRSTFGQGTTIRIVLPLTLAIMDGMLIRVGEEVFIMPLGAIKESMQVQADQLKRVGQDKQLVYVRGEYLPLVEMHRVFDIDNAQSDVLRGIVMVIESEGRYFTLLVDELLGQRQVVVKNLETNYRKVVGISAATILGDGSVALILDVVALSRAGRQSETQVQRAALA
jgi:two-component system chemotaxis sensor kinase CheA